jgi:hypothetical protein
MLSDGTGADEGEVSVDWMMVTGFAEAEAEEEEELTLCFLVFAGFSSRFSGGQCLVSLRMVLFFIVLSGLAIERRG